ncbi:putative mitochondrial hypothetical protein [Leptomonas pyrrhocoris]|uniref:Uncharacterized protein n=1 Tax=Leptomonas pyrrhocoris TaxID=157538 RepID=A0A0M9GAQ3_LEPPY|nr:putative mitochondrial hypothetical protein [Leptomonas pyrrhocoris]XP_015664832.1 putative mitochondrial hypothetical protein [Leptomonas pyrrhocoris]KPA86392.1 putative mitochondrial hypothetical protein [Leptomonas pyrrhocoris]KPA86393.1 putative mitochondrial hypothetical protein [Leptomonas pyrrhocoris]|eukprot:XP_015664831.1 putative mitochondrial hypothetical protein [Leptomonas pyrrhocoris]
MYESRQMGLVHVARRRSVESSVSAEGSVGGLTSSIRASRTPHSASTALPITEAAMAELQELFPDFLVPVKALWETTPEAQEESKRRVMSALRAHQSSWLTFYAHPAHRAPRGETSEVAEREQYRKECRTSVLESGYVMLSDAARLSLAGQRVVNDEGGVHTENGSSSAPTHPCRCDVRARLADYTIQPYEWYRVARVLPTAAKEVLFGEELYDAAAALLPSWRDVWQVLFSAPHLFTVRYDDGTECSPSADAAAASKTRSMAHLTPTADSAATRLFVRFNLHPRFIPPGVAFVREEELLQRLGEVAVDREKNRCGLTTRQRRHKRKLQRQLTYLRNPTPYFDDRVLAQHLFDLLPMRHGVHQSALLGALPSHAVSAFPHNVTDLLKERGDLFRLADARHGVLVQRADAVLEESQRSVDSVTGEEVLQCIFSSYSTHNDPRNGTTISRSLARLPRLIRERLFAMHDVVQELLCLYPEKVAVLSDASLTQQETQLDERATRELQNVRGRRDFLIPFRFVGEWEEKLLEKYTRHQEKELAKSGARKHSTNNRRPRY